MMKTEASNILVFHLSLRAPCVTTLNGQPQGAPPTRRATLLLFYLTKHRGQAIHRDFLAEALWPDAKLERARSRLRSELWRLKQWFDLRGLNVAPFLSCERSRLVVDRDFPVKIDTESLHQTVDRLKSTGLGEGVEERIQSLLEQFQDGLLPGEYHAWIEAERSQVNDAIRECREYFFHHFCRTNKWREAISEGQMLIDMEPLDEYLHAELMRCYIACECRGLALRQYAHCRKLLREELGVAPSQGLETLYREILCSAAEPELQAGMTA